MLPGDLKNGIPTAPPFLELSEELFKKPLPRSWSPSPEQAQVIESWGRGMAVQAGAGCGKTTTLVQKCVKLLERNPQAHFAAVSFTERSASDLRSKLSQKLTAMGIASPLSQHWVMTIHGLCGSVLREFPSEAGFDGEESVLTEGESALLWERAIEALWYDESHEPWVEAFELLLNRESRTSLVDLLQRLRELETFGVLDSLEKSSDPHTKALGSVGRFVLVKYQKLKKRQGVMDFSDLEKGADRALAFPRVQQAYHRRFDLVLIDEFQDTNPVQARILWRLARLDRSNLCVVGDPKQSIYRFRDADVTVFQEYCQTLPEHHALTWNFRSRPPIIQFTNQVCELAFSAQKDSGVPFEALVPKRESVQTPGVLRLDVMQPSDLGKWIQSEVRRGVALDSMALLLRRIRGNERWLKAIVGAGIPIAVGSGGLFWEDPRVRELVAFLKWWDQPQNTFSGAVFLRAPWMHIADVTLDLWVKEDPTLRTSFLGSAHGVARVLQTLVGLNVRPGELLLKLLEADGVGEPVLENELGSVLLGLWHRAEELSCRGIEFSGVVREFSKAVQEGRREREVPASKSLGQLSVLTLHGAKGLEFPHVILLDFGNPARAANAPLLYWDREDGAFLAGRDELGQREKKNKTEELWKQREKVKSLAESKRLFYVALTRAQERLILVFPPIEDAPVVHGAVDPAVQEKIYATDFWRGWIEYSGVQVARAELESNESIHVDPSKFFVPVRSAILPSISLPTVTKMRARHSVTEWGLLSRCPRAYEWKYIRPSAVPPVSVSNVEGADVTSGEAGEQGIAAHELGSRVHKALELSDFEALVRIEQEVGIERFRAEPLIQWAQNAGTYSEQQQVFSELNFEVAVGRNILVGTMDRVVVTSRDGVYTQASVLDFKVSSHLASARTLLESYQTQMTLYVWALTQLEPSWAASSIRGELVAIAPAGVKTISVPRSGVQPNELADAADRILQGEAGVPRPGRICQYCEFRKPCLGDVTEEATAGP